jgi:hypothetical protein
LHRKSFAGPASDRKSDVIKLLSTGGVRGLAIKVCGKNQDGGKMIFRRISAGCDLTWLE